LLPSGSRRTGLQTLVNVELFQRLFEIIESIGFFDIIGDLVNLDDLD